MVECAEPALLLHSDIVYISNTYGSEVTYICDVGYTFDNHSLLSNISCTTHPEDRAVGMWTSIGDMCQSKSVPQIKIILSSLIYIIVIL